jgi:hypothetical protein
VIVVGLGVFFATGCVEADTAWFPARQPIEVQVATHRATPRAFEGQEPQPVHPGDPCGSRR